MRLDWSWTAALATAAPAGLGHLCHLILAVNVVSGLGRPEALLDRLRLLLFSGFWISSVLLLWWHLHAPWWTWPWPFRGYAALCVISGLVIWPVSTLDLALRRRPEGIAREAQVRELDLARPGGREEFIGEGSGAWLLRLPGNESFRLRLCEWDVPIPGLPAALDGLRIVQLTDLHMSRSFRPAFFERVIDACHGWDADLVVVTGDIIDDDEAVSWIEPVLAPLEARLGKFAILGNHDEEHQPRAIIDELTRAGFEALHGTWAAVEADGATIAIGGTSAPWGPDVDPAAMPPADFRILLSHSPDRFYRAVRSGIDLMLSGHNHGGQIRLPLVGAVFMPSVYSRRFDRGFFRRGRTLMYASDGIAGNHPVRYGCPPEVTRFVLRAAMTASELPESQNGTIHSRRASIKERDRMRPDRWASPR
jgi:predicted MPP superfamily phosphohydrolase